MRTRSDSQNSSSGSHSSSNNSNSRFRRQIDQAEEAEELDDSHHFERNRDVHHSAMATSSNHPGLPPQPSHLASPFIPPPQQQQQEQHTTQQEHDEHPWGRRGANNINTIDSVGAFDDDHRHHHHHHQSTPWILTLCCPMTPSFGPRNDKQHHDDDHDDDEVSAAAIIRVHVTADMTPDSWRQCIQHATAQYSVAPIAGLFRKGDFGYFSLEYIWETSSAKTDNEYWLYLPHNYRDNRRRQGPPRRSFWQRFGWSGVICLTLVIAAIAMLVTPLSTTTVTEQHEDTSSSATVLDALLSLPTTLQQSFYDYCTWLHQVCIHHPIQDFYRHGPTWLGAWEGMPLSQICVRLSLMGDEDFWRRNMDDCERMYQLKQEATVRTIQPLVYAGILYLIWSMIKVEYLRRRQYQPDPNMVELYHAFHVVLRQVQRVLAVPPAAARH